MQKQVILKKLQGAVKTQVAKLKTEAKKLKRRKGDWHKNRADRLNADAGKLNVRNVAGLTYKVRSGYFSDSRGNCEFFPDRMHAHSYRWYTLFTVVKGIAILNDYRYSQQTSLHISKMVSTLKTLGIKYETLEAPRGLQNLNDAFDYNLMQYARLIVRQKYARNKGSKAWYNLRLREFEKTFKLLSKLGYRATKARRAAALERAENERTRRNEETRAKAARRRAIEAIEVVFDETNQRLDEPGYHVVRSTDWGWHNGQFTLSLEVDRYNAHQAGHTKIIVHRNEPRHLQVVR